MYHRRREGEQEDLNMLAYLQNSDSYTFLEKVHGLLKTGPSNTNVCDLQIYVVK